MTHTLFLSMLDDNETVEIRIVREPFSPQAKLTVSNDVEMKGEIRQRAHFTGMESTSPAKTAYKFFKQAILLLNKQDLPCEITLLDNLPKMARDTKDFKAEATIQVGARTDDELRAIFEQEMDIAKKIVENAAFSQRAPRGRNWTNRKGGRAAGL